MLKYLSQVFPIIKLISILFSKIMVHSPISRSIRKMIQGYNQIWLSKSKMGLLIKIKLWTWKWLTQCPCSSSSSKMVLKNSTSCNLNYLELEYRSKTLSWQRSSNLEGLFTRLGTALLRDPSVVILLTSKAQLITQLIHFLRHQLPKANYLMFKIRRWAMLSHMRSHSWKQRAILVLVCHKATHLK